VIQVQRPTILCGIEEFVTRGDLGDRSVFLNLPPIDPGKRRREDELWPAFHQDQPMILGGLLAAIFGGLQRLLSIDLPALPRMADFAAFGEAVGRTLDESQYTPYALAATISISTRNSGRTNWGMTRSIEAGRPSPRKRERTLP
jgi:hypothetical protein